MKPFTKLFSQQERSIRFYKYFASYVIPLFIVLLILRTVIYRNFISTLQSEVVASNTAVLTQMKNTMDIRLKEMERTAVQISSNSDLMYYKILNGGIDSYYATRELKKYKSSNEFLSEIAFYYNIEGNDRIITTLVDVNLDFFLENIYMDKEMDKDNFIKLLNAIHKPTMLPDSTYMNDNNILKDSVTYMYPLPLNAKKPYCMIMYMIDKKALELMVQDSFKDYKGYIYILDDNNTPVAGFNENTENSMDIFMLDELNLGAIKEKVSHVKIGSEDYSVVKLFSEYNKWSYVAVLRTDQFMSKINATRNIFYLVAIIIIVFGVVGAFLFAEGNYKPLKDIKNKLNNLTMPDSNTKNLADEFIFISSAINEVSKEKKELVEQLKSKASIMKGQLLLKLLNGKPVSNEELENLGSLSGLKLEYPYFGALVILIDEYDRFKNNNDQAAQNLMKFCIVNVLEELALEIGYGYGVELLDDRGVILLLNIRKSEDSRKSIEELAQKTQQFFKQHFKMTLTVGIGSVYNDRHMIHISYMEANKAVYYRMVKGNDSIIFYDEIKNNSRNEYQYPIRLENSLVMAVKKGDYTEAQPQLDEIRKEILARGIVPESIPVICFGIINAIIRSFEEAGVDIINCLDNDDGVFLTQPYETIDELFGRITTFCSQICNYIQGQRKSKSFELREKIMDIINKNYTNKTLGLENIAHECGLSPSYVSRYFKEQTGYPLMQYIDMMRMNEVKRLLKDSDLPLKEVLGISGYIDESNFIRKFRIKEGVTPIQYRSMARMD